MNKLDLPRAMTYKARLKKEEIPTDKYIELNRLALLVTVEKDTTDLVRQYKEIIDNYFNK